MHPEHETSAFAAHLLQGQCVCTLNYIEFAWSYHPHGSIAERTRLMLRFLLHKNDARPKSLARICMMLTPNEKNQETYYPSTETMNVLWICWTRWLRAKTFGSITILHSSAVSTKLSKARRAKLKNR